MKVLPPPPPSNVGNDKHTLCAIVCRPAQRVYFSRTQIQHCLRTGRGDCHVHCLHFSPCFNRDICSHEKNQHAKFHWILSNFKNLNKIRINAFVTQTPSIVLSGSHAGSAPNAPSCAQRENPLWASFTEDPTFQLTE